MMPRLSALALSSWLTLIFASVTTAAEPTPEQLEFFEAKIRPVLVKHCYECHSSKIAAPRGGLRLDDREAVLKGGDSGASVVGTDPAKSPLIQALRYDGLEMPPKGKLPPAVVADFEAWVKQGAPDPRASATTSTPTTVSTDTPKGVNHWAFQRPTKPEPPTVKKAAWPTNEIDRFILSKLESHDLQPTVAADRRTLIRRAYFDLIGLPPEPEKVEAFLKDPAPDLAAFGKIVDELLQSPHYGERWARYWLDVARYGEDQAHTFKARNYPRGYMYRDWVVNAFNSDLPYDSFLKQQIAGDLLEDSTPPKHERIAALGLFALGPVYYQDNGEKDKALLDEWDDRVDTLIRGTQALTISCARCHDHKFDPLSMTDYYGLIGVFASTQYTERPAVSDVVVLEKQRAETAVKEQQLEADRFLASEARTVRELLVPEIPKYVSAAWQVMQRSKTKKDEKKAVTDVSKQLKLNEDLVRRWVAYLEEKPESGAIKADRPYLAAWRKLRAAQSPTDDLSKDEAAIAVVAAVGDELRQQAAALLPLRSELGRRFGEDMAFIAESDRATVEPGIIPLGNLFDDAKGTQLGSALASDSFRSTATEKSLGVARVAQGWGHQTTIATGINFDFQSLGSDGNTHGSITNDGWDPTGGIRTQGKSASPKLPRTEQGIGMHSNALITFDLEEIRRAGLIPADRTLTFRVDRAGLNDDVIGSGASSHLAVIVTKPHQKPSEFDAILFASVNGEPAKVEENDGAYYFTGTIPEPLRGNGKFATFNVPLPPEARYLTLVATGAGKPGEENTISSDHAVFSGARIEFEPTTPGKLAVNASVAAAQPGDGQTEITATQGLLHSELFSDKGVLAIPSKDVGAYLTGEPAARLAKLNTDRDVLKKAADQIAVPMAHALSEGQGMDFPIYLAGDPRKKGALAPRAFPAVLTGGQRHDFNSKGSGRLELARAITSTDNPLTARVWVNRVWAGHFGTGLVRTPSNFGTLGERPSHPELLDWLAVKFMESGWSLKTLQREIMLSSTYRLANSLSDEKAPAGQASNDSKVMTTDPENRLLSHMSRRRLEVEPWRDAVLSVAGTLDRTAGGPSSNLSNANNRRRTLYGFVSRHELDELLRLFDFPDPNITAGQRTVTTVPLQQLFVLNSEFMVTQSRAFAARLAREASTDEARIRRAFQLLFNREPNAAELQIGQEFVTASSETNKLSMWEQYALALMGSNEFLFVD